jgi:hypothetical protein
MRQRVYAAAIAIGALQLRASPAIATPAALSATISTWLRFTQPANTSSRNWNGATDIFGDLYRAEIPIRPAPRGSGKRQSMILPGGFTRCCAGTEWGPKNLVLTALSRLPTLRDLPPAIAHVYT